MRRILLLDDEEHVLSALVRSFRQIDRSGELTVERFTSAKAAVQRMSEAAFDILIADYHMPEMDGVGFLRIAREMQPDAVRMMLSASAEFNTLLGAINDAEAFRFIAKPWTQQELGDAYRMACERRDQIREEHRLADIARVKQGRLSEQDAELRRLEEQEPGITKVRWGKDGSVLLDE